MATDSPAARSRRERPAKPALTRAGIVDAALTILRDEGLSKVTMRRIAAALDTGPASLYVYVRNTEDLHAQILDALLGPVVEPATGPGGWRDRTRAVLVAYRDLLFGYPELARMALSTQPSGPHYLTLVDTLLGLLVEGGASDRAAAWGVDVLLLQATAIAAEHAGRHTSDEADPDLVRVIAHADPQRYPQVARLAGELTSGDGTSRSAWTVDVLLDGILARPE
jgi:AcrR family transcriptional regulator